MVNTSLRFVEDPVSSLTQPVCELRLKIVPDAYDLLIKSTQSDCNFTADGEIATHELANPSRLLRSEMERLIVGKVFSFLPRLDYTSSGQNGPGPFQRLQVLWKQPCFWNDVIIYKQ